MPPFEIVTFYQSIPKCLKIPDKTPEGIDWRESPVPELSFDAVHVEGDPVKVQALIQPGSDLRRGIHNEIKRCLCDALILILHQADVAQGQGQFQVEEISEVKLIS